jgi:2-hydroxy-3-keto-5-methylthiopentenyl-1-phosphate phosphatase
MDMTFDLVEILNQPANICGKEILYLIHSFDLMAYEGELTDVNLVCVGFVDYEFVKRNSCNLILVDESYTALEILNKILKIQKKYNEWNDRIINAVLLKLSMKIFFEIALEKIHSPMILLGPMNTLLMANINSDTAYSGSIWDEVLEKGYLSYEHPLYQEFLKKAYQYHNEKGVFLVTLPKHEYIYLTANIFQDGKICGAMQFIEVNQSFSLGQIALITYIRSILEKAIKSMSDFQLLSTNNSSYVTQLLNHIYVKESIIENCLKTRGWKIIDEYYCMLFLYNQPKNEKEILLNFLLPEFARCFPMALILNYKSGIVVISRCCDFQYNRERLLKKLGVMSEKFNLTSGISSLFYDFKELKRYYDECNLAIKYGVKINPNMRIHFFGDYVINHLTRFVFVENGKNQYINSKVELLQEHDEHNGTEFVKTLLTYFLCGQSKSLAAEKMHLHRNSLVYRLDTIYRISGIDCMNRMMDENEIFHIMLSCKFCDISQEKINNV